MEESKYKFLNPSLWKGVTADEAMGELERIREKHGLLKPETVIEESRDEKAVLHKCFQWDDSLAAAAWRKEQARQLIKNITVVVTTEHIVREVRAMVNVSNVDSPIRSYIPISKALDDQTAYKDLLRQAKRDMESFIVKYANIKELDRVRNDMQMTIQFIDE